MTRLERSALKIGMFAAWSLLSLVLAGVVYAFSPTLYYISPNGSDSNNGTSSSTPWKTFNKSFTTMSGCDDLTLLGTKASPLHYTKATTGLMSNSNGITAPSNGKPPSGTAGVCVTVIHGQEWGGAILDDSGTSGEFPLMVGTTATQVSYVKFRDLFIQGGGGFSYYHADHVAFVRVAAYGRKTSNGSVCGGGSDTSSTWVNTHILLQDVICTGIDTRIGMAMFRTQGGVARRVVIRIGPCTVGSSGSGCSNSGGVVGFTGYDSQDLYFQDVAVVDSVVGANGRAGCDGCNAWHASGIEGGTAPNARNSFGNMYYSGVFSLFNTGMSNCFNPDIGQLAVGNAHLANLIQPVFTYRNVACVISAANTTSGGINVSQAGGSCKRNNITSVTSSSDSVTLTTNANTFSVGNHVRVVVATSTGVNSEDVTLTGATSTTVTYTKAGAGTFGPTSQGGVVTTCSNTNITAEGILVVKYAGTTSDAIRVATEVGGLETSRFRNMVLYGAARGLINVPSGVSAGFGVTIDYNNLHKTAGANYYNNTFTCTDSSHCDPNTANGTGTDPTASSPVALSHLTRIESGSFLASAGYGGADRGPSFVYQVGGDCVSFDGTDECFDDDAGFNTLSATKALFPWKYDAMIMTVVKANDDDGTGAGGHRGLGNASTFTNYVLTALGGTDYATPVSAKRLGGKQDLHGKAEVH